MIKLMVHSIPYDFIEDENLRLRIYQRISLISDLKHINLLKKEIRDRFGNIHYH